MAWDDNRFVRGALSAGKRIGYSNPVTAPITAAVDNKDLPSRVVGSEDLIPGFDPFTNRQSSGNRSGTSTSNPKDDTITSNPENPANPGAVLGASTGSGNTAADLAYFDSQEGLLRNMLGRTGTALDQGLSNITDSYNREASRANTDRSRALENFGMQREDTTRAKQDALGRVDTNARVLNNSLRQILGLAAGSGSSAYQYAAPNAVARQASGQRGGVLSDYAENERDLGVAERRATEDYDLLLGDLARSRADKERELRSGIFESEQDINTKLANIAGQRAAARGSNFASIRAAQAPFESAINDRQRSIDSLFEKYRSPALSAREVRVDTPELRDYMTERVGIDGQQTGNPYEPYSGFLRRQLEEELL